MNGLFVWYPVSGELRMIALLDTADHRLEDTIAIEKVRIAEEALDPLKRHAVLFAMPIQVLHRQGDPPEETLR